jgi:hypothetical protein
MAWKDLIIEQFRKDDIGIKLKALSEDEAQIYEDKATKRMDEFTNAEKNELYHLYESFGHSTSGGYDPRVWLIDFLAGKENIIAIPTNHSSNRGLPSYLFSTGEDAYQGMQGMWSENWRRYWLLDSEDSFFIYYDYVGNTLFMMGEELIKWANAVRNRFYTVVGLSDDNYDFHLLDTRVENWGRRLILDCIYKPKGYPIDRSEHMTIIFSGCNEVTFEYMNHRFVQKHIHPKLWMWMGYRPAGAEEMSVPANLSNISVDIKFTYESITVIKDRSYFPPPDIFTEGE